MSRNGPSQIGRHHQQSNCSARRHGVQNRTQQFQDCDQRQSATIESHGSESVDNFWCVGKFCTGATDKHVRAQKDQGHASYTTPLTRLDFHLHFFFSLFLILRLQELASACWQQRPATECSGVFQLIEN